MKSVQLGGLAVFAGGLITDNNLILLLGLLIQILALLIDLLKDRQKAKDSQKT